MTKQVQECRAQLERNARNTNFGNSPPLPITTSRYSRKNYKVRMMPFPLSVLKEV